jgi:hypothetical protein
MQGMFLYRLRCFHETAVGIGPTTDEEHPMLDEHRQELGIDLTQDAPGFRTPRLVDAPMALPQFKQEFDLPADPRQHQGFP